MASGSCAPEVTPRIPVRSRLPQPRRLISSARQAGLVTPVTGLNADDEEALLHETHSSLTNWSYVGHISMKVRSENAETNYARRAMQSSPSFVLPTDKPRLMPAYCTNEASQSDNRLHGRQAGKPNRVRTTPNLSLLRCIHVLHGRLGSGHVQ